MIHKERVRKLAELLGKLRIELLYLHITGIIGIALLLLLGKGGISLFEGFLMVIIGYLLLRKALRVVAAQSLKKDIIQELREELGE